MHKAKYKLMYKICFIFSIWKVFTKSHHSTKYKEIYQWITHKFFTSCTSQKGILETAKVNSSVFFFNLNTWKILIVLTRC